MLSSNGLGIDSVMSHASHLTDLKKKVDKNSLPRFILHTINVFKNCPDF